ncbi:MAG: metallophosphoesterase [Bacteroidaceae bacterium]|nr:metallophosphoesterase [Bacteroidaceae bacterium]
MKKITYALIMALLTACDMVEYHPYDVKIDGPTNLTRTNCALIEQLCAGKDTLRFAHLSDTQRFYDETEKIVNDINHRDTIDFVIHTGDMTDFGLPKEYVWQRRILNTLKIPYITAIGNHDCLGTGEAAYHKMFGDDNFSLNAAFLHIVSLNTNAYEYDYSKNIPDFAFMKADIASLPDSVTSTIIAMHVAPGMFLFNDNVADYFNQQCLNYRDLRFCICGHDHRFEIFHPFGDDGTTYYQCDDAKSCSYIIYTVTRNSYTYEIVQL